MDEQCETVLLLEGRPDRASARGRWYLALAETGAAGLDGPGAACWEARLRREEANLLAVLEAAERAGRPTAGIAALRLCVALAPYWIITGRESAARVRLERAVTAAEAGADAALLGGAYLGLARTNLVLGDLVAASATAARGLQLARHHIDQRSRAAALEITGRIATATGDHAVAAEALSDAIALHGNAERLAPAGCLEALAGLWRAQHRFVPATRMLGAAAAMRARHSWSGRRLDHHTWAADLAALRQSLPAGEFDAAWQEGERLSSGEALAYAQRGRGPRQRPSTGWASLTATECEVVRLAGQHLTNREIAGRLFMSPRTVQTHLSHAFAKLGVATRRELAREDHVPEGGVRHELRTEVGGGEDRPHLPACPPRHREVVSEREAV